MAPGKDDVAEQNELNALRAKVDEFESRTEDAEQREKLLQRREEVLRATLDAIGDGVLVVDNTGHIIMSNREFARMWHIPPDLIEAGDDKELVQFVSDQLVDPEAFLSQVEKLYRSFHESCDILEFHDGRVYERRSLPLVIDYKLCGRVWTFRNIVDSAQG
jgi:PAS domain-containing protein